GRDGRARARDDVEDVLASLEPPRLRAARVEADEPLLEALAALRGVEGEARLGGVARLADRLDIVGVDDRPQSRAHARDSPTATSRKDSSAGATSSPTRTRPGSVTSPKT